MEHQNNLREHSSIQKKLRRRSLLPWWIKIFIWIFLVFGAIVPVALIFGILGNSFQISLYGIQTNNILSLTGIALLSLFLEKAIVAYGLWTEKAWAISFGIADGVLGILICIFSMFIVPILSLQKGFTISFRLELVLLIPYLIKLITLRRFWNISSIHRSTHP